MAECSQEDCPELKMMQSNNFRESKRSEIIEADFLCFPTEKMDIHGPNGTHYCFVYPVLGPKVSLGIYAGSEDLDQILRSVCSKIVQALAFLHRHNICHDGMKTPYLITPTISITSGHVILICDLQPEVENEKKDILLTSLKKIQISLPGTFFIRYLTLMAYRKMRSSKFSGNHA